MNLLVINFVTDRQHPVLAYQCDIIDELAKHVDQLHVLTSKHGDYQPAENVRIHSIPVRPWGIPQRFGGCWFVNPQVYRICKQAHIHQVFIHMAKDWSFYLWPSFKTLNLPVTLWYAHGSVPWSLKLASACATQVVSASEHSCRLNSPKLKIIGHGINTKLFQVKPNSPRADFICVGRFSAIKRLDLMIEAVKILNGDHQFKLTFIGQALTEKDQVYYKELKQLVASYQLEDTIVFLTNIQQEKLAPYYQNAKAMLHLSQTNSIDKVVLEALACGCPVLTSSPAFVELLSAFPEMLLKNCDPKKIADALIQVSQTETPNAEDLRATIMGHHDFESFPKRLLMVMRETT